MTNTNATTIRRNITLSKTLDKRVGENAKRIGLTYAEFVRHILANEISKSTHDDWGLMPLEVQKIYHKEAMETLKLEKEGKIKSYDSMVDLFDDNNEEENNSGSYFQKSSKRSNSNQSQNKKDN